MILYKVTYLPDDDGPREPTMLQAESFRRGDEGELLMRIGRRTSAMFTAGCWERVEEVEFDLDKLSANLEGS
jgi:hypothetical protein